jgi:predicted protein tyrosine phosphatase
MLHVLFVCSRNQWRSPTAERLFWRSPGLRVRSAGTSRKARRRLQAADLRWADVVLVMEEGHAQRVRGDFAHDASGVPIEVLDIPDDYRFMDPELVALLQDGVPAVLARHG